MDIQEGDRGLFAWEAFLGGLQWCNKVVAQLPGALEGENVFKHLSDWWVWIGLGVTMLCRKLATIFERQEAQYCLFGVFSTTVGSPALETTVGEQEGVVCFRQCGGGACGEQDAWFGCVGAADSEGIGAVMFE